MASQNKRGNESRNEVRFTGINVSQGTTMLNSIMYISTWQEHRECLKELYPDDTTHELAIRYLQYRLAAFELAVIQEEKIRDFSDQYHIRVTNMDKFRIIDEELKVMLDSHKGQDIAHLWEPCRFNRIAFVGL